MQPTPHPRGRHALRWVLGVAFAFVVVVGMALQVARTRADERWDGVMTHGGREWPLDYMLKSLKMSHMSDPPPYFPESRGGNIFRGWREGTWVLKSIGLRQERNFFGNTIEAHMSGAGPRLLEAVRAILAEVDVEVIVDSNW